MGIGTGTGAGDSTLEQMSIAGGFPRSPRPSYYPVFGRDDLAAAIEAIAALTVH